MDEVSWFDVSFTACVADAEDRRCTVRRSSGDASAARAVRRGGEIEFLCLGGWPRRTLFCAAPRSPSGRAWKATETRTADFFGGLATSPTPAAWRRQRVDEQRRRNPDIGKADTGCGGDRLPLGRPRERVPESASPAPDTATQSRMERPVLSKRSSWFDGRLPRPLPVAVFIPPSPAPARPPLLDVRPRLRHRPRPHLLIAQP